MEVEGEVADQAGRTRRPANVSLRRRRRAGGRASEVAGGGDTPGAAGNGAAAADIRDDPDERYLSRTWGSQTLCSALLLWAKARHFTHPPVWLSGARREAGAGGELLHRQAARLCESLSALALALEVAIMIVLCLFRLTLIPAGRARAALRVFMVVSLASSLAVLAVTAYMAGSADAAAAFLTVLPSAAAAVMVAMKKLKQVLAKIVAEAELDQREVDG